MTADINEIMLINWTLSVPYDNPLKFEQRQRGSQPLRKITKFYYYKWQSGLVVKIDEFRVLKNGLNISL